METISPSSTCIEISFNTVTPSKDFFEYGSVLTWYGSFSHRDVRPVLFSFIFQGQCSKSTPPLTTNPG